MNLFFSIEERACFENRIDYAGSSDDNIETDEGEKFIIVQGTALACQRSCQELANCQVWTFEPSSNKCWRKLQKVERKAKSDVRSGQKFCGVRNFGLLGVTLEDNERVSSTESPFSMFQFHTLAQFSFRDSYLLVAFMLDLLEVQHQLTLIQLLSSILIKEHGERLLMKNSLLSNLFPTKLNQLH